MYVRKIGTRNIDNFLTHPTYIWIANIKGTNSLNLYDISIVVVSVAFDRRWRGRRRESRGDVRFAKLLTLHSIGRHDVHDSHHCRKQERVCWSRVVALLQMLATRRRKVAWWWSWYCFEFVCPVDLDKARDMNFRQPPQGCYSYIRCLVST
jgi:hypothetical protein